jgi:hypothetical protein
VHRKISSELFLLACGWGHTILLRRADAWYLSYSLRRGGFVISICF